jgi:hypothetical protein
MGHEMVTDWTMWINLGVPMTILVAVAIAGWKVGKVVGGRILGIDDQHPGLLGTWVAGEMKWRGTLTERLENQQSLCETHATSLQTLGEILQQQTICSQATQKSLQELITSSNSPTAPFSTIQTNHELSKLKKAAIRACDMCSQVAEVECPTSSTVIAAHCNEIKKIINASDSGDIDVSDLRKKAK